MAAETQTETIEVSVEAILRAASTFFAMGNIAAATSGLYGDDSTLGAPIHQAGYDLLHATGLDQYTAAGLGTDSVHLQAEKIAEDLYSRIETWSREGAASARAAYAKGIADLELEPSAADG